MVFGGHLDVKTEVSEGKEGLLNNLEVSQEILGFFLKGKKNKKTCFAWFFLLVKSGHMSDFVALMDTVFHGLSKNIKICSIM